jgi:hypothetical protein
MSRWNLNLAAGMIVLARRSQCSTGTAAFRNCPRSRTTLQQTAVLTAKGTVEGISTVLATNG